MASTINRISGNANNMVERFTNNVGNLINITGDYVAGGNIDRRHGMLGLVIGPLYDTFWKELTALTDSMLGITIGDYCNFNDRMYGYMSRLMLINLWEHNTTLAMLCEGSSNQAQGNSDDITNEALKPDYITKDMDYRGITESLRRNEQIGINATEQRLYTNATPYPQSENLFPDDLDKGNGDFGAEKKWEFDLSEPAAANSILYKTKCLFAQKKINSTIARFGTEADNTSQKRPKSMVETAVTEQYGASHGRNLLLKQAEKEGGYNYTINGYNNPYCRVWTHHYQYDRFSKTMRPFKDSDGNYKSIKDVNNWGEKWQKFDNKDKNLWKEGAPWDKSVMNERSDGLVNITPKFNGGGKSNIHTKDCMFSIENLAWKDYDPYSFETALSWEQRGPLGGRIMWFPPYGLSFNETSSAQWQSNTFIGRGEDVYTYVNTKRHGTLRFLMIVDHPSVLDYVTWYEANKDNVTETDILRYFAGCDPQDPNNPDSLLYYAEPTPLTDEEGKNEGKIEDRQKIKKKTPPSDVNNETNKLHFNVFFPNNYSGIFDTEHVGKDNKRPDEPDFAIKYLLAGLNTQKKFEPSHYNTEMALDLRSPSTMGNGYEITENAITDMQKSDYVIVGNEKFWANQGNAPYKPDDNKKWYYRIDGLYEVPEKKNMTENEQTLRNAPNTNTYDQKLNTPANYQDTKSFKLNSSLKNIDVDESQKDNTYTFTEVLQALALEKEKTDFVEFFKSHQDINGIEEGQETSERVAKLREIFSTRKISKINILGIANTHGANPNEATNQTRNNMLSLNRARTINHWLTSWTGIQGTAEDKGEAPRFIETHTVESVEGNNVNTLSAKIARSAHVTIIFENAETTSATETDDNVEGFTKQENKIKGYDTYKDSEGATWLKVGDEMVKLQQTQDDKDFANEQDWLDFLKGGNTKYNTKTNKYEIDKVKNETLFNTIRYDQEYHFFKRLEKENPFVFKSLMERLQYFDPAFHSMTPEGFNARLTFLNQCTRQGNTVGVSDKNRLSANNMAFGRPPFCVLRIGDFYNQMIVIDSVNIDYDVSGGIVWDLNDEGIGVQPMLAQVSLNFTFIGGSDMGGAVRQLLNAQSFNYYANTSLYDNRASRVTYTEGDGIEMGGAGHGKLDIDNSTFPTVAMYDPNSYLTDKK